MSLYDLTSYPAAAPGRRRHGPMGRRVAPVRRRRQLVDWRAVALVAISALLLIAMMARP